ncbi:polygalacturonase-1 non-catalytic subunit beta-like [Quercus robur]|uniref:polygalacturonase-1 non-catalytic subunit beta-like n=1 Tax=Quercus robur TaxID=38942 RepID=UPI0021630B69|nr:polygalacturonase-1 non-catalytic subunit beta-like [Quercus robur]XP_050276705.1 polygalacturonase-1 non-catalytic subunit beta-like [Quercus robur]
MALLLLVLFFSYLTVGSASASAGESLSTPKSNLIQYWNKEVRNNNHAIAKPTFLLSKASPLSAVDSARFSELAAENALSSQFLAFCASANLFCFPDSSPNLEELITHTGAFADASGWVQSGIFFRESMLKKGKVLPMPDIKDKMPKRSFLPRSISSKLPFSTSKVSELKKIFHVDDNSTAETMIVKTLSECESAPSPGETKRCVGSAEDMIDFAISVLGRNIVVRSTENFKGSKQNIMIGSVEGINGGKVTQIVSCHQTLFPYLLYHCHSVPKVRVYEVDILDPNSKAKINHGVASCHMHTSDSNPNQAELTIASGPGQIKACHWVVENHLIWTVADLLTS